MRNSFKVSIIVPVYNTSKYLHRCLDSVLNQTYKDFECICINDGSTDNSLEILEEYKRKDKRIVVLSQKNWWLSAARNTWLKNARWEYVTFLDSDDFLKNDYIEQFVRAFSKWDYDMVIWWYIKYTEKSESNVFVKDDWISMFFHTPVAWRMFKTSVIKNNNLLYPVWLIREDAYFSTSFYNLTNKIWIIQYAWYYYFIENPTSLTHTAMKKFDPRFIDWLSAMKEIKPMDKFHEICNEYFLIRGVVFYLLYSWRWVSSNEFMIEYKKLFWWLKKNIPNYRKNKYISLFVKSDSNFIYKLAVWWFMWMDRLKLIPLFSKVWCK